MKREEHHILHDRVSWESRDDGKRLRRNKSLIVPLDHDAHAELHRDTPVVPLLGYHELHRVARDYEPTDDYLKSIESLQRAIERAGQSPKAHYVERQVGQLTIHVLELQKPYIETSKQYLV